LRALLSHGDFYKAAAADCGCHDNRIDKVWWNELWMGWPIGPHYEAQAAQTDAHKLKGRLLLTVGELDTNVDPACTLRVVDALVSANKDFDFLLLPGKGHGAGESPFAARRRAKLFFETLGGPR
jgi:dipeptidyl aminopeptidase/acylaminoacyl peptidase